MAEERDDSQKTLEPTQRRLEEAREKGDVPRSQDLVGFTTLSVATLVIAVYAGSASSNFVTGFTSYLSQPHALAVDGAALMNAAWSLAAALGVIAGVPMLAMLAAAIAGHLVQAPLMFVPEKIKPQASKLSPLKGLKRLFGMEAWVNFIKGVLKVIAAGAAGAVAVWPDADRLAALMAADAGAAASAATSTVLSMLSAMLAAVAVFAALDWFWQRWNFMRRMRMSRQDMQEELKQSEGDPLVKMKIRSLRMNRARQRMMAQVPKATVVVTNPTHYAVALRYDSESDPAPVCVAKGLDLVALRIREVAAANGVPVVENPPLARALFSSVEVEATIPAEHFKAVAQIIGFIMRQRKRA